MFVKYNAVLRGLDTDVPFLKNSLIKHCCPCATFDQYMGGASLSEPARGNLTFDETRRSLNTYTTTLHVINSAVVKLSKLTIASTVYRGVGGRVLPEQ